MLNCLSIRQCLAYLPNPRLFSTNFKGLKTITEKRIKMRVVRKPNMTDSITWYSLMNKYRASVYISGRRYCIGFYNKRFKAVEDCESVKSNLEGIKEVLDSIDSLEDKVWYFREAVAEQLGRSLDTNDSRFSGITWNLDAQMWRLQIKIHNEIHTIAYFPPDGERLASDYLDEISSLESDILETFEANRCLGPMPVDRLIRKRIVREFISQRARQFDQLIRPDSTPEGKRSRKFANNRTTRRPKLFQTFNDSDYTSIYSRS